MAQPRTTLHELLKVITPNVYFQPPTGFKMEYPCIRYTRNDSHTEYADNDLYEYKKRYQVTVIDRDPDSTIPDQIEKLPYCRANRFYAVEDLNHSVFNLFF